MVFTTVLEAVEFKGEFELPTPGPTRSLIAPALRCPPLLSLGLPPSPLAERDVENKGRLAERQADGGRTGNEESLLARACYTYLDHKS